LPDRCLDAIDKRVEAVRDRAPGLDARQVALAREAIDLRADISRSGRTMILFEPERACPQFLLSRDHPVLANDPSTSWIRKHHREPRSPFQDRVEPNASKTHGSFANNPIIGLSRIGGDGIKSLVNIGA
jgi:hypothetical protein